MWWLPYVVISIAMFAVGGLGARATEIGPWYRNLNKPRWNPPDWAFPVVWTSLYVLIILSVGRVWNAAADDAKGQLLMVIGCNLVLNVIWSVLFFTMRKPRWALVEVVLMWVSIVVMIIVFSAIDALSAWLLVPYLVWVSVASFLNFTIIRLNPDV